LLCVFFIFKRFINLVPNLGLAAGLQALISFFVESLIEEQKLSGELSIFMKDDLLEFHILGNLLRVAVTLGHHQLFKVADLQLRV
jgi:hypothetical protein